MRWAAIAVLSVAACGRFGFDPESRSTDAAPVVPDATPPDAESLAQCTSSPTNLGNAAGSNHDIVVVATPTGFIALTTDSSQAVRTWATNIASDGTLQSSGQPTTIGALSNGTLGIVPAGAGVLIAGGDGNGTYLQAIDANGAPIGDALDRTGDIASEVALATSGVDGAIAFATVGTNGEIDARKIDNTGADASAVQTLVAGNSGTGEFELATAGVGYAATWTDSNTSPHAKMVQLFGPDFASLAGPVASNTSVESAENGQVGWAASSHVYLSSWQDKDDTDADEVSIRLYDASLTPLAASAQIIMTNTGGPRITSDGTGFYVTARGYFPNNALVISYVAPDGTVTAIPDLDLNGNAEVWAATARAGQTGTAWVDSASVYLDVPCPP